MLYRHCLHRAVPSTTSKYGHTGLRLCRFRFVGVDSTLGTDAEVVHGLAGIWRPVDKLTGSWNVNFSLEEKWFQRLKISRANKSSCFRYYLRSLLEIGKSLLEELLVECCGHHVDCILVILHQRLFEILMKPKQLWKRESSKRCRIVDSYVFAGPLLH